MNDVIRVSITLATEDADRSFISLQCLLCFVYNSPRLMSVLEYKNITYSPHLDFGVLVQWLGLSTCYQINPNSNSTGHI